MKPAFNHRVLVSFIFLFFLTTVVASAQTLKDMFSNSETPVFYYGIDFTKAKLIDDATASASDVRDNKYTAINQLIINESDKYDLKAAFNRTVDHDISEVNKRNEKANAEAIMSTSSADFHRLKESDIDAIVKSFDAGGKKAVGLLFIVEAMSKSQKSMAVWVTLFDPKSKKVLMTERMEGKATGFGFRNYWAGSIKDVLTDIKKKKYSEWKTKYGG
ncbi:MAG: hypothetical protein QM764_01075 [Chitinophagaceae bacterium]